MEEAKIRIAEMALDKEAIGIDQLHKVLMRLGIPDPYNRRIVVENLDALGLIKEGKPGSFKFISSVAVKILDDNDKKQETKDDNVG